MPTDSRSHLSRRPSFVVVVVVVVVSRDPTAQLHLSIGAFPLFQLSCQVPALKPPTICGTQTPTICGAGFALTNLRGSLHQSDGFYNHSRIGVSSL